MTASWLAQADQEMARTHPKRYAAPRGIVPEPVDSVIPPARVEPALTGEAALILRVDATIRWLVAYRALVIDERRCSMGATPDRRSVVGPERRPVRR
jgi:hypothetical protein